MTCRRSWALSSNKTIPAAAALLLACALGLGAQADPGPAPAGVVSPEGRQGTAGTADPSIAGVYLLQARAAFQGGDDRRALELLDLSLEFSPGSSEGLYLQARILMKHQEDLYRARAALEAAVASGRWSSTPPREALQELARVYVLTHRYAQALTTLGKLPGFAEDAALGGAGSAEAALLWAQALAGQEAAGSAARRFLGRALERYPDVPDLYALQARLLAEAGDGRQARQLLDRALQILPGSTKLMFTRAQVEPDAAARLGLLDRYFAAGGGEPAAAALALMSTEETGRLERELARFLELGGNGNMLALDALGAYLRGRLAALESAAAAAAEEAAAALLAPSGGMKAPSAGGAGPSAGAAGPSGSTEAAAEAAPAAELELFGTLVERLEAAAAAYSGSRTVDVEGDGLYEERYSYEAGVLTRWVLDSDQDGLFEAQISYAAGLPAEISLLVPGAASPEQRVDYVYSRYPYLDSLRYPAGQDWHVYRLVPFRHVREAIGPAVPVSPFVGRVVRLAPAGAVGATVAAGRAAAGQAPTPIFPLRRRLLDRSIVGEDQARQRATRLEELPRGAEGSGAGVPPRVYTLLAGAVVRLEEDPDPSGRYRHVVLYEGSRPVSGSRDLDGDGRFELREEYAGGALRRIFGDANADGVPEYVETFEPGGTVAVRQQWDYDGDGTADSRQLTLRDGSVVREFSSRLDGVFDLRASFRGGRITSFQRNGRELPVRYDAAGKLYRIGGARDLPVPASALTEGLHVVAGREFFVFTLGGNLYIGELE